MYKMKLRIRYSDSFQTGKLSIHAILELFQDVGFFESEDLGLGMKHDYDEGNAWFLLAWHIDLNRLPEVNEYVTITTVPYKMKGFFAYRRYQILDRKDNCLIQGDAIWIYMDSIKMLPHRISEDVHKKYIPVPVDYKPIVRRKLNDQGEWILLKETSIPKRLIDTNGHLNNTNYITLVEEYMDLASCIGDVNIEYRLAAKHNDILSIYTCDENEKKRFLMKNQENEVSCIIEYSKKTQ